MQEPEDTPLRPVHKRLPCGCDRRIVAQALLVFCVCLAVYSITNYGGIRPPDSEAVFRVAASVADGKGFSPKDIESWPGFGVAPGRNGELYSVYPPVESFYFVPAVKIAELVNRSGWYLHHSVPMSHYVGNGLRQVMFNVPERDLRDHALRYVVSWFDVAASALVATLLYVVLAALTQSGAAAVIVALFYAFGTLAWPYAGSFFSEPVAMLFALASFYGLGTLTLTSLALSGIALGLAVGTHPTAVLFFPLFAAYLVHREWRVEPHTPAWAGRSWVGPLVWLADFAVIMLLLGVYNYARFGSFLESGRGLSAANKVVLISPVSRTYWHNLYDLLVAPGKGILLFCPAVILAAAAWPRFHRTHRALSIILLAAVATRLLFNASYKDWHAGFSLGPRYLLMIVPFTMIPLAYWLRETLVAPSWRRLAGMLAAMYLCVAQQLYFALGEIFSYYHLESFSNGRRGVDIFANQRIYTDWKLSPLLHLHEFKRGPFLFQYVRLSNLTLWAIGSAVCLGIIVGTAVLVRSRKQAASPTRGAPL
jgi:hypothetical protein